jgi:hypothetical protein
METLAGIFLTRRHHKIVMGTGDLFIQGEIIFFGLELLAFFTGWFFQK